MKILLLLVTMLWASLALWAHPHVFIDYSVEVVLSRQGLEGLQITWFFDRIYTHNTIKNYTKDNDQIISKAESKVIEKETFRFLKDAGYFADFEINGLKHYVDSANNFVAECHNDLLVYHFFIPWKLPLNEQPQQISISFFDYSIYCRLNPQIDGFKITTAKGIISGFMMTDTITYKVVLLKE